jgi:tRNA(fMet)-specific endonuclease VapC
VENRRALDQFLHPFVIAPFDLAATVAYGQLRATLGRQGTPIGPLDCLIAAQAHTLAHTLATANERAFGRIPDLPIENWTRAT